MCSLPLLSTLIGVLSYCSCLANEKAEILSLVAAAASPCAPLPPSGRRCVLPVLFMPLFSRFRGLSLSWTAEWEGMFLGIQKPREVIGGGARAEERSCGFGVSFFWKLATVLSQSIPKRC